MYSMSERRGGRVKTKKQGERWSWGVARCQGWCFVGFGATKTSIGLVPLNEAEQSIGF